MKNSDMPAMPYTFRASKSGANYTEVNKGLSKREHYAGLAMQGLLSTRAFEGADYTCDAAVKMADALLEQLEK